MLSFSGSLKVFVALEPADMRKGFNGLHGLITEKLREDPRSGSLFVFTNRRRHQTTFSIPIWHRSHRLPVASTAWATVARSPAKGAERNRGH
jgi:transposase